jgi:hypothetical protein
MFSVFRRENHIHAGSAGYRDAAADGHESSADVIDAYRYTVPSHVSEIDWLCHEHHAASYCEAGNIQPFAISVNCVVVRIVFSTEIQGSSLGRLANTSV